MKRAQSDKLFKIVDLDGDGFLSLSEGNAWCRHMNPIENGTCCPTNVSVVLGTNADGTTKITLNDLG